MGQSMPWALQLRILRNRAKEGEKRFGFVELEFHLVPRSHPLSVINSGQYRVSWLPPGKF